MWAVPKAALGQSIFWGNSDKNCGLGLMTKGPPTLNSGRPF